MARKSLGIWGLLQRYAIRIGGGAILAIQAINHKDWLGLSFQKKVEIPLLSALSFLVVICLVFAGVHILELINWPSPKEVMRKINVSIEDGVHPRSPK